MGHFPEFGNRSINHPHSFSIHPTVESSGKCDRLEIGFLGQLLCFSNINFLKTGRGLVWSFIQRTGPLGNKSVECWQNFETYAGELKKVYL